MSDLAILLIVHVVALGLVGVRLHFDLRWLAELDRVWVARLQQGFTDAATVSVTIAGDDEWINLGRGSKLMSVYEVVSMGFGLTTDDGERVDVPPGAKLAYAGEARVDDGVVSVRRGGSLLATLIEVPAAGSGPHRSTPRQFALPAMTVIADPANPLRSCARVVRWRRVAWLLAISASELALVAASARFNALALFTAAVVFVLGCGGRTSKLTTLREGIFTRPLDPATTVWTI